MNTAVYQTFSREQLVQLLVSKEDEVISLKAMNREANARLNEVEQSLVNFMERFAGLDHHDAALRDRLGSMDNNVASLQKHVEGLEDDKDVLHKRIDELEGELEHEVIWRRGFYPYLGLSVSTSAANGPVEVIDLREPAKGSGVEIGDCVTNISFTAQRRIQSIGEYQRAVADLPPDATVTIELQRRGKKYVVQFQPKLGSYRKGVS